ncbi:MAG: glutamine-hydrolyzing carbamoyl-phosphate synthase small subunit [Elusimicrobia bacterium]|nr:glutamine-hydrolyzing carbamoyl-phosphate synthase small subunit [Elusimicrobiota bacterium]
MTEQGLAEREACLVLEDGTAFRGRAFGSRRNALGEVVFNTGMVGYPESFTDPSYRGQILALTYPLIGNYGVPADFDRELSTFYESGRIHLEGLVVSEYSQYHHHWTAARGLSDLLVEQDVPGIDGVDTRALTKHLRTRGPMAGRIVEGKAPAPEAQVSRAIPRRHLVSEVSVREVQTYGEGAKTVAVVDCGCKNTIIRSLLNRKVRVLRVPWDFDATQLPADGFLFSNGPGDPKDCGPTIETAAKALAQGKPLFGICLGNQILALSCGGGTYKLKFGHRGQNQPCRLEGTRRCFITSQNHGYAADTAALPEGWEPWFTNLNDGTNEGLRHRSKPFMSVQFHPEAMPGPVDTGHLFDEFVAML